ARWAGGAGSFERRLKGGTGSRKYWSWIGTESPATQHAGVAVGPHRPLQRQRVILECPNGIRHVGGARIRYQRNRGTVAKPQANLGARRHAGGQREIFGRSDPHATLGPERCRIDPDRRI